MCICILIGLVHCLYSAVFLIAIVGHLCFGAGSADARTHFEPRHWIAAVEWLGKSARPLLAGLVDDFSSTCPLCVLYFLYVSPARPKGDQGLRAQARKTPHNYCAQ